MKKTKEEVVVSVIPIENFNNGCGHDNGAKADFETAMEAAGFGMFNIALLIVALPASIATIFETSTMSYILPSAECDLNLSLLHKGLLNSITYAGMITSAIFWGYLADTKGRKNILVYGFLADSICVLGGALSQNVVQLMIFKYSSGLIMSGPYAVLMTYLNELHSKMYRERVMMCTGVMFSLGTFILPILALTILPQQWDFQVYGMTIHSWQIFLAATAIPSLLSAICLPFFPESPKFLMSQGRNEEATIAFQSIYSLNKHRRKDSFPIKDLVNELLESRLKKGEKDNLFKIATTLHLPNKTDVKINEKDTINADQVENDLQKHEQHKPRTSFLSGIAQLRPLFMKPYLRLSLWVYFLNFCVLLGHNTMRLWLPQLFASTAEYDKLHTTLGETDEVNLCTILEFNVNRTSLLISDNNINIHGCEVIIPPASYANNLVVGFCGVVSYVIAAFFVKKIGVKRILTYGLLVTALLGMAMYWSNSSESTVIIAASFVTLGSICSTSVISASVNLFPTSLRTMIISIEMMVGRFGSLLGNVLFPVLVSIGCAPPFFMISSFILLSSLIAAFLPIKTKTDLK